MKAWMLYALALGLTHIGLGLIGFSGWDGYVAGVLVVSAMVCVSVAMSKQADRSTDNG